MSPRARIGMAATCLVVALLAGTAAFLSVFARGTGAVISVTSVRGATGRRSSPTGRPKA